MIEMLTNDRVVGGITRRCAEKAASIYRVFCQGEILLTDASQRRDGQARRERLPRRQHRLRQRTVADLRLTAAGRVGGDRDGQPSPAGRTSSRPDRASAVTASRSTPGSSSEQRRSCLGSSGLLARSTTPSRSTWPDRSSSRRQRFREPTVACLGLAFKANVDDMRESPAVDIVSLICEGLPDTTVLAVDPFASRAPAAAAGPRQPLALRAERGGRAGRHHRPPRRPRAVPRDQADPPCRQGRLRHARLLALTGLSYRADHPRSDSGCRCSDGSRARRCRFASTRRSARHAGTTRRSCPRRRSALSRTRCR